MFTIAADPSTDPFNPKIVPGGSLYLGGVFESYNSARRIGIARLFGDGRLDTGFMDNTFNHFAGLTRQLSTQPRNACLTIALQANGDVMMGGDFERVGIGGTSRFLSLSKLNIVRLNGGSSPGPGNIEFSLEEYTANENGGPAFVLMSRTDGALGQASAYVSLSDSAATAGSDYVNAISTPVWPSSIGVTGGSLFDRNISAAFMGPNNGSTNLSATVGGALLQNRVTVSVLDDLLVEGNESLNLRLTLPPFGDPNAPVIDLGGEPVPTGLALGRDTAVMVIADNDFAFGQLGFSANSYTVLENAKNATITITRTNGATGTVGIGYRATLERPHRPISHRLPEHSRSYPANFQNPLPCLFLTM